MTPEVWANGNGRMFLPSEVERYIPYHQYEAERFTLYDHYRERQVTRPTFMETSYDELIRFIGNVSWPDEIRKVTMATPVEDIKLTPEDTRELDEFLSSFSKK